MKHFHFSGISGTAMGTLAVMLKHKGFRVTGSDSAAYPPISDLLRENGIDVREGYSAANLSPRPDCVVIGNALSRGNPEVEHCLSEHMLYRSSAEVLKEEFIRGNRSVVVAGTHGKTTVTALIAQVLDACGLRPGFFIGGKPGNFPVSGRAAQAGGHFVIEGDEYDTAFFDKRSKFFHYLPDLLILNNLEFDHEDIFENLAQIKKSFSLMLRLLPANGTLLLNGDDENAMEVAASSFSEKIAVGTGPGNDVRIHGIRHDPKCGGVKFALEGKFGEGEWVAPLLGEHNARNAALCVALALRENLPHGSIARGLAAFSNNKRRLELLTRNEQVLVYDDFAHHPTAIKLTIEALREKFPERRLIALYEPRSNTSVRNTHRNRMPGAFSPADSVFFHKIHQEERVPEEQRLDIPGIVEDLNRTGTEAAYVRDIDALFDRACENARKGDVMLVMSQGNFFGLAKKLARKMDEKYPENSSRPSGRPAKIFPNEG